ncbi:polygalacturonase [Quercus suber]|uniref:Polygalacturonase n=1 Tax=Quercus suber TaxID=58331 RepID=A0AAW0IXH8_QUESU
MLASRKLEALLRQRKLKSVPCQQVVLSDIDLTYKGGGGSTTSTCANVQPAVSSKQNPPTCTNKH